MNIGQNRSDRNYCSCRARSRSRISRGFTLIELLVVISIIALLVAILLPALGKAREQAKLIKCASKSKSIGLAMSMYSHDYDGYYPAQLMPGNLSSIRPGQSYWWQLALPYMGDNKEYLQCPSLPDTDIFIYFDWDSPSLETAYGINYSGWTWKNDFSWTDGEPGAGLGYVIKDDPSLPGRRGGVVNELNVRSPSSFIMVGDTNRSTGVVASVILSNFVFGTLGAPRVNGAVFAGEQLPNLHGEGANIVFMDGHVAWMAKESLLADENLHMWKRGGR